MECQGLGPGSNVAGAILATEVGPCVGALGAQVHVGAAASVALGHAFESINLSTRFQQGWVCSCLRTANLSIQCFAPFRHLGYAGVQVFRCIPGGVTCPYVLAFDVQCISVMLQFIILAARLGLSTVNPCAAGVPVLEAFEAAGLCSEATEECVSPLADAVLRQMYVSCRAKLSAGDDGGPVKL